MTRRERFRRTVGHKPPDRPPIDIGALTLTGMRPLCQARLVDLLGLPGKPVRGNSGVDERILEWAGTDFRGVGGIVPLRSPHTRQLSATARVDCWGVRRDVVGGEGQITQSPLRGATREDLLSWQWPDPRVDEVLLEAWQERARMLRGDTDYITVAEHPVLGILELGCWVCGYDDFMLKLALDPDFVRAFFDRVLDIQLAVIEQYYAALGPYIEVTTSGDDFGTQRGPLLSPEMFGDLVAPRFRERIRRTKEIGECLYWHHTCGSVAGLLDQIIDCGVDILNPVQTSADGMEPGGLKARFGDRIVFWGAVDVQQFLPGATETEVCEHIAGLRDVLGRDGGYVIAPAHEIQDDVPPENLVAWVETMRSW